MNFTMWELTAKNLDIKLRAAEARIAALEEALRTFAALADEINGKDTDYVPCSMLCADFNRARKVLDHEQR